MTRCRRRDLNISLASVFDMEEGVVRRATRWGALAALVGGATAIAAVAGTTGGHAATAAKKPIVIGWAFDSKGNMAPFDNLSLIHI